MLLLTICRCKMLKMVAVRIIRSLELRIEMIGIVKIVTRMHDLMQNQAVDHVRPQIVSICNQERFVQIDHVFPDRCGNTIDGFVGITAKSIVFFQVRDLHTPKRGCR